jgi:pimeloyl-ACP methyl ester carboxylesterase
MGSEVSGGHCDDLHQLLESLEIKKAVLVGLAMGAGIAMDMALRDPARVSGLVLVSPGFSQDQERDNNLRRCQKEYLEALDKHDHEAMVECFQRSWTDGPYRSALQVPPQLREKVHSMALKTVGRWQEGSLGLCRGDRLIKSSFDIRQPALLVVGNLNTPEILDTADVLLRRIRNSRKIVVPHVGHLVNMEAPEQFNNLTLEFINQIEGGKNEIR